MRERARIWIKKHPRVGACRVNSNKLEAGLTHLLSSSLSKKSNSSYERIWRFFQLFIFYQLGQTMSLPVPSWHLGLYLAYLHISGFNYNTARSHLSVINFAHSVRNLPLPCLSPFVSKLLKGFKNLATNVKHMKPITFNVLQELLLISSVVLDSEDAIIFNTIASMLYCGNLRVGELLDSGSLDHTLKLCNAKWYVLKGRIEGVVIYMPSYKHSGTQESTIMLPVRLNSVICPVKNLLSYLELGCSKGIFLFIDDKGNPISSSWFLTKLHIFLSRMGLDPSVYFNHSFRVGYTTDIASSGESIPVIQMRGRWKSTAFNKYIRPELVVM